MDALICASCGNTTSKDPCIFCNESPLLEGKYRFHRLLGEGGQGTVFFASDPLGREVAIKRFRLGAGLDMAEWNQLDREIQILRQIEHPNIPNYIDHFRAESGPERYLYLVQEYVEGRNLKQVLEETRFTSQEVMKIVARVAEILGYLHGLSPPVIHRDIKPGNIMRRSDGSLYLIDFGCVRDSAMNTFGATIGVGTFLYMAPEQHRGEVSPSVDIYSLGVTAGHLLSREPPNTLRAWRRDTSLPAAILALMDAMLQEDPEKRPSAQEVYKMAQSAIENPTGIQHQQPVQEIATDTTRVTQEQSQQAKVSSPPPKTNKPTKSRVGVSFILALLCGGFFSGVLTFRMQTSTMDHHSYDAHEQGHSHGETAIATGAQTGSLPAEFSVPQSPEPLSENEQLLRDILVHDLYQGVLQRPTEINESLDSLCGEGYEPACLWKERQLDPVQKIMTKYILECGAKSDVVHSCLIAGWGTTQTVSRVIDDSKDSFQMGIDFFSTACEAGNKRACTELAYAYERSSKHKNLKKAYQLYIDSCQHGIMYGCTRVGWFYGDGLHVELNSEKRNQYLSFACSNGEGDACRYLGDYYSDKQVKLKWYDEGCEKQSRMSCNSAAIKYDNGDGTDKNVAKAVELYKSSCSAKSGHACYNLGLVYKDGGLGEPNLSQARQSFTEACQQQHWMGCYQTGDFLLKGKGGEKEIEAGWKYMFSSCEGEYYAACHYIGYGYANGEDLEQDGEKALSFYKTACENDVAVSCNNIGSMYYNAKVLKEDKLKAYSYFQKSCNLKNETACNNIQMMKDQGELDF